METEEKNPLVQIIELVRRSEGRCVIVDDEEFPYAVMSLGEYERLSGGEGRAEDGEGREKGLTSKKLLDKISQDIITWKSVAGQSEDSSETEIVLDLKRPEAMETFAESDRYFIEPAD